MLHFSPQMLALKTVRVDGHGEQADALLMNYWNEIELLGRLKGSPFIINLEAAEVSRMARRGFAGAPPRPPPSSIE